MKRSFSESYTYEQEIRLKEKDDSVIIFWIDTSKIWSKLLKYTIIHLKTMR